LVFWQLSLAIQPSILSEELCNWCSFYSPPTLLCELSNKWKTK
jgi:hypothetical protein